MPSTYTTSLSLEKQANGENSGTWGTKMNTVLDLIEQAIAGVTNITHDDTANYTLTATQGASNEARNMVVNVTGALTAARNVVVPTADKLYVFKNSTTGGYAVTIKTSGGTGISVANGETELLYCDGTNVLRAQTTPTGTGAPVRATSPTIDSPTLTTPNIGVATATSVNGVTLSYSDLALDSLLVGATTPSLTSGLGNHIFGAGVYAITSGVSNTLIGVGSGTAISSGGANTVVGRGALYTVSTTSNNTAIGEGAGALSTGSQNTFIGASAATGSYSGSNLTVIGYNTSASAVGVSNEITLGNSSIATLRCQVTSITSLSDRRDKTDIAPLAAGLDTVMALKPVRFTWNMRDGGKVGIKDAGFIAQDLQEVDDEHLRLVYAENPEKLEASYGRLIPVLVKAIQELKQEVDNLRAQLSA